MNETTSEGWIDRYGRILAAEALKTHRSPEDALAAIKRQGALWMLWMQTGNPRMPSFVEDGPLTPFLMSNIRRRLEAEEKMRRFAKISNLNGIQVMEIPFHLQFPSFVREVELTEMPDFPGHLVLVPQPSAGSQEEVDQAKSQLDEVYMQVQSWLDMDEEQKNELAVLLLKRVQAAAVVGKPY